MGGEKEEHRCSEKRGKACIDEKKVVPLCDFAIMEQGARSKEQGQWTMDNGQWTKDLLLSSATQSNTFLSSFLVSLAKRALFLVSLAKRFLFLLARSAGLGL